MKVAVVIFPGSNCDHDALYACEKVMGWDTVPVWHENSSLGGADLVILPGGFSYGDYLRCGAIARFSPIVDAVVKHANSGGLTLGICNGFQVLIEAGLLPGALLRNACTEFRCVWTQLKVQTNDSLFTSGFEVGDVLKIPIAHGDGNYFAPPDVLEKLNKERRVAFRYCSEAGQVTDESNPNGSVEGIAGVLSEGRNVLGMMPHPERASEALLGSADGRRIFESLGAAYADVGW
ncbi:phosphoribosylformylglycinamidine synthase subunit PurQ [bacterium]|nr:phosphoribosylformylglycinamidine synthase subunit PurQ [bacterium]